MISDFVAVVEVSIPIRYISGTPLVVFSRQFFVFSETLRGNGVTENEKPETKNCRSHAQQQVNHQLVQPLVRLAAAAQLVAVKGMRLETGRLL